MALNFGSSLFMPRGDLLANYNYVDILEGQAFINYFAGVTFDHTGTTKEILNTINFESSVKNTEVKVSELPAHDNTFYLMKTLNFELEVNFTQLIRGRCIVEWLQEGREQIGRDWRTKLIFKLQRIRGAVTDNLATSETGEKQWASDMNTERLSIILNLTGTERLNKGDKLVLIVEIWGKASGTTASGIYLKLWHDPMTRFTFKKNYQSGAVTENMSPEYLIETYLSIKIPFRIEI